MEKEISLALACFRLGVSYDKGRRMLFTGALVGRQHDGKWLVNEASLARVVRKDAGERQTIEPRLASA